MPYKDKEKQRQWRALPENKEKARQCNKKWYALPENKEKNRQRNAQWLALPENREKARQRNAQWYALPENKEKARQRNAQWYALPENKEKRRQLDALPENKEKARQQYAQWRALPENREKKKQRYATDLMYRLNITISTAIRASLHTNNLSKNNRHWESLVGYTLQELKLHLEQQFDSYMNWENHGSYWHLDHIIPLASLTFNSVEDENFKLLWSLGNLQPLFGPENLSKKNKILVKFYPLLFPFTS